MVSVDLTVHYQGAALDRNTMSVEDLAPSLLALSDVLKRIQHLYNPEESPISLDIKATEKGSFAVVLALFTHHELMSLLSGQTATAGANLLAYVGAFSGLVAFIVKASKHKVKNNTKLQDGDVRLTFDDGTIMTIPSQTLEAYKDIEVRRAADRVVEPARKEGIDVIEFASSSHPTFKVSKADAEAFVPPVVPDEVFEPTISIEYLQLITISFQKGGKWKFSDGNTQFFAKIEDDEFVNSVTENRDQFGSTDSLKVRLRKTQSMTESGLKSDVVVEKVLEHVTGAKQLELDLGSKKDDALQYRCFLLMGSSHKVSMLVS